MSCLTCITGIFMNFELLPILTNYANLKKGGMKFKKLKGDHPRIISAKFGLDWLSNFTGEDFFFN
jgi:hypothetical protein